MSKSIASFSLGGIPLLDPADATGRLHGYRYQSVWSADIQHTLTFAQK